MITSHDKPSTTDDDANVLEPSYDAWIVTEWYRQYDLWNAVACLALDAFSFPRIQLSQ